ncbi:uncharacterized protein LOC100199154 [Hydra vulgaris]|uniref:uncharacterized protein LOC100199154 n=1 Tax=Hydra vulgaris TaxID=6087 RepID=UPI001F5FE3EB|nr:orotidine 5'-phosphate decarboxylase [Hydra vulgaris]
MINHESLIRQLFEINAIRFGKFKLKSGIFSPIYINFRVIISYPKLLRDISNLIWEVVVKNDIKTELICGVPYTALPIATCVSVDHDVPLVVRRREAKDYGTKQIIEGEFKNGQNCLIVEDVVTTGGSIYETYVELKKVYINVTDAVVLMDREQGGRDRLLKDGIKLHSVFELNNVLNYLTREGLINETMFTEVSSFILNNQYQVNPVNSVAQKNTKISYRERAKLVSNPVAKRIFNLMEDKKTNLALSADITNCSELLRIADLLGPHICILKIHVDIMVDFSSQFIQLLQELAKKHDFVIFEDRKFADIGNTVKEQYSRGIYKIRDWADLINAHGVPGDGVLLGLKEEASGYDRGCLLVAQMTSLGALTNCGYSDAVVQMAERSSEFVIGFISTSKLIDGENFLYMTPGVNMAVSGDELGQQYLTPEIVVRDRKCDVIIVGRGIYNALDPLSEAIKYKEAGFKAYLQRLEL